MFWLISEGYKHNSGPTGRDSAHAHWLVYKTSHFCDLMADTELPVILYSKESGPRYLATQGTNVIQELSNCKFLNLFKSEAQSPLHSLFPTIFCSVKWKPFPFCWRCGIRWEDRRKYNVWYSGNGSWYGLLRLSPHFIGNMGRGPRCKYRQQVCFLCTFTFTCLKNRHIQKLNLSDLCRI